MRDHTEILKASAEVVVGTSLILTPWWSALLSDIHFLAATIASVCGAVIGVYGLINVVLAAQRSFKVMQRDAIFAKLVLQEAEVLSKDNPPTKSILEKQ